jgi:hypothetical protein
MGTMISDKHVNYSHRPTQNQTTSWLVHNLNIFGARMNHMQTWTHKTHHGSDLKETTTFPLIVFSMHGHEPCTQMSFCPKIPKLGIPKWGLSRFWRPITFCANLKLRWGLKQSCSPCQELFQQYAAHNLHAIKWRRFSNFNGWELNW